MADEENIDYPCPEKTEEYRKIRTLRKKIRQIEKLEVLDRQLCEDEVIKVCNKSVFRAELHELLKAEEMKRQSENHQNEDSGGKRARTIKKEPTEESGIAEASFNISSDFDSSLCTSTDTSLNISQSSSADHVKSKTSDIENNQKNVNANQTNTSSLDKSKGVINESSKLSENNKISKQQKSTVQEKCVWGDSNYQVFTLAGHNDIIHSVDCTEELILSASRDTTVKVWRKYSSKEERSLRGHTASVTSAHFIPEILASFILEELEKADESSNITKKKSSSNKILAISGSLDCSIKLWNVLTGEELSSVYTYNGITVMSCGNWGVITGTEGGKLEVWCIATKQCLAYSNVFQCKVTALYVDGNEIYAASEEGDVGVWQFDQSSNSLNSLYVMEVESHLYVPLRQPSSIVAYKGVMYIGDSGPNIKVIDWKKGVVTRLVNHITDIGMTDSLALSSDGHLLSSSYLIDSGSPSFNVRKITGKNMYVCTLLDEDEGRYLSMSAAPGIIVTGGHTLKVWIQGEKSNDSKKKKKVESEMISSTVIYKLKSSAIESASEDDTEWASSSDEEEGDHSSKNDRCANPENSGWWCSIL